MNEKFYYDLNTNPSFVWLYESLLKRGVDNNKFFLKIYNKELIGVDPYDPYLTRDQKKAILKECKDNIWYFLRIVKFKCMSNDLERFRITYPALSIIYLLEAGIRKINSFNCRQQSVTVVERLYILYEYIFRNPNLNVDIFNIKKLDSEELYLNRIADIYDSLPEYFKLNSIQTFLNPPSVTIRCLPIARTKQAAEALGRCATGDIVIVDNSTWVKYFDIIYRAAMPAIISQKSKIIIHHYIPDHEQLQDTVYQFLKEQRQISCDFNIYLFDYEQDKLKEYIDKHSLTGWVNVSYTYNEIDMSEKDKENMRRDLNKDPESISRELELREYIPEQ